MSINILIIVPARAGSKGVVNKNMYPVLGKPLIGYTLELLSELPYDYCITTDDDKIINYAKHLNLDIHFKRPGELAADETKMIGVLIHAINSMEKIKHKRYTYILLLQPTAPLRSVKDIEACIELMKGRTTDSVISVNQVDSHHPILMKKIENGYLEPFCIEELEGTRRQDYSPKAYMRNGAIYLAKRDNIVDSHSLWGNKIVPYVMDQNSSVSIDNLIDIQLLESVLTLEA